MQRAEKAYMYLIKQKPLHAKPIRSVQKVNDAEENKKQPVLNLLSTAVFNVSGVVVLKEGNGEQGFVNVDFDRR